MEPTMISLKALSTATVLTLALPMAAPTVSFAQNPNGGRPAVAGGDRPGGGALRFGGAAAPRIFNGGGGRANVGAPVVQAGPSGGNWRGNGGWRGNEGWRGDHRRDRDGGFLPGVAVGAVIGGAIASQSYGYYGGPAYYGPGYADDQYYNDGATAVAPAPADDDAVSYCIQNFSSYDPASGTYLGNDGYRHPCP
jgi:BA14K-like protein